MLRQFATATALVASAFALSAHAQQAPRVELTWMSIANWDMKIGDKRVMMDAYITRLPENLFIPAPGYKNDLYAYTKASANVDMDAIRKVKDAVVGSSKVDYLLVTATLTTAWTRPPGPS